MIHLNLLRDWSSHAHEGLSAPAVSGTELIYLAIFLLTAAVMGTWRFDIHRQIATGIEKRDRLRVEESYLQKLNTEIEGYQEMKQKIQRRIDGIEQLRKNQTEPALLLDTILQSIPGNGNLWLTSFTRKADSIRIVGFAPHIEVIPDFMSNLMASGTFDTVDLEEIENRQKASKFSLLCTRKRKREVGQRDD